MMIHGFWVFVLVNLSLFWLIVLAAEAAEIGRWVVLDANICVQHSYSLDLGMYVN